MMKLTIFPKLLFTMLVLALLPLISIWYLSHNRELRALETQLQEKLAQIAKATVAQVNAWADTNLRALRHDAALHDMISMEQTRQTPILQTLGLSYEWTYLVFALGPDGYMTARNDEEKEPISKPDGSKAHFRGDRPYFQQVMQGHPFGQQVLISRTNNQPAHCLAVPINRADTTTVGALVECALLVEVSRVVTDVKVGKTGFAFLVDNDGKVIAHGQKEKVKEALQDFTRHPALTQASLRRMAYITDDTKPAVAYVAEGSMGWKLVVQQDEEEAFASLREAHQSALTLLVIAVGLVGVTAFLLARGLAKPLRELTIIADGYSRGELDATLPSTDRSDEIGALAQAVQRMGMSLKIAFDKLHHKTTV